MFARFYSCLVLAILLSPVDGKSLLAFRSKKSTTPTTLPAAQQALAFKRDDSSEEKLLTKPDGLLLPVPDNYVTKVPLSVDGPSQPAPVRQFEWSFSSGGNNNDRFKKSLKKREVPEEVNLATYIPPRGVLIPRPEFSHGRFRQSVPLSSVIPDSSRAEYSWARSLGNGKYASETAFASEEKQIVVVNSLDEVSGELGYMKAQTIYDFSTPISIQVVAPENGPCFLMETDKIYQQLVESLNMINGSIAISDLVRVLDGRGKPLSSEASESLFKSHPVIEHFCWRGIFIKTVADGTDNPNIIGGPTVDLQILTLDSTLKIKVPDFGRKDFVKSQKHVRF